MTDFKSSNSSVPMAMVVGNGMEGAGGGPNLVQTVQRLNDPALKGLVVRQESQFSEVLVQLAGLPYNKSNGYAIMPLPEGKAVKKYPGDRKGWSPSARELVEIEQLLFAREDSNIAVRALYQAMGLAALRPLKMRFRVGDGGEAYLIDRPFRCGGGCFSPLEMNLFRGYQQVGDEMQVGSSVQIGRVQEDWDNYCHACCMASCCATHTHRIQRLVQSNGAAGMQFETAFVVVANQSCCCGPNNCCAPTCIRSDAVFNIYDNHGQVVGKIEKSFAGKGDCMGACCRLCYGFDNYVIEFPDGALSADDRMLIVTSIIQLDFQVFEDSGGTYGGG